MRNLALWTAQLDALREAWRYTPAGRKHAQVAAVAKGTTGASKSQARRFARSARAYLDPDVVLPEGTPKPDEMREAKKRPIAGSGTYRNTLAWESNAPSAGCREMRGAVGSKSTRSVPTWGSSHPTEAKRTPWERRHKAYFADTRK